MKKLLARVIKRKGHVFTETQERIGKDRTREYDHYQFLDAPMH